MSEQAHYKQEAAKTFVFRSLPVRQLKHVCQTRRYRKRSDCEVRQFAVSVLRLFDRRTRFASIKLFYSWFDTLEDSWRETESALTNETDFHLNMYPQRTGG